MLSPDTRAGRRRAQTNRRLPDLTTAFSSLSRPTLVKGLVGLGLATSVAAAVAIPVQASPGQVEIGSQTTALVARERAQAAQDTTSRSTARTSVSGSRAAMKAPAAGQSAAVSAGPAGVTAVAKPKPKPTPTRTPAKVEAKQAKEQPTTSSTTPRAAKVTGSGVSMAFYDWCHAKSLGSNASKVCSAVRSNFGIENIGGFRAGAGDHGSGKAVDVMVTGSRGDAVAQWAINNMSAYNITYVIWKQRIWLAGASSWRAMEDRGSVTANHYDHVHISVE
ncbi:hypothetical protein GCM10022415_06750 [Knoellia locipacati]|uniref:ARB-07466-like C-terminal domain-containing protein n=1 Tax=Knoellia locipacati TaxID=882824 RepID=A0A512SXH1_9MICO|nr:hypothetical protein [Knoellia locipacati]GEQ12626.1 hypothetical protein KLO01_06730 [Knoellia locipacati]